jgi:hypothetical protein
MISESTSNSFLKEADEYHKLALGGLKRKKVFTNEILYNLISISVEKYIMGFLTARNQLPLCHTLKNMVNEVKTLVPVHDDIVRKMCYFDGIQNICSLVDYNRKTISDNDITEMVGLLEDVKQLVTQHSSN